jgi:HPt (histidine-containing phosphotransfer) domain-containing protein
MALRDVTGVVDFAYLDAYVGGDVVIVEEVLNLFLHQVELWTPLLDPAHEGWRDAAHTLKGAALGIGAKALSEAAHDVEHSDEEGAETRIDNLKTELDKALLDVSAYLHGLQLKSLKT